MFQLNRRVAKLEGSILPPRPREPWHEITIDEGDDLEAACMAEFSCRPRNLIINEIVSPTFDAAGSIIPRTIACRT